MVVFIYSWICYECFLRLLGSILNCERQNDLRPSPATFTSELPGFN